MSSGYLYCVLRPVSDRSISSGPALSSGRSTTRRIFMRRLPYDVEEVSRANAGTCGLTVRFTMFLATVHHAVTVPCGSAVAHRRVWITPLVMRHCEHWLPGLRFGASACV